MKRVLPPLLLLLCALPLTGAPAQGRLPRPARQPLRLARQRPVTVPNQLVVRFAKGSSRAAQAGVHARAGARVIGSIPQLGVQTVQLPSAQAARFYTRAAGVLWAEPNGYRYPLLPEPDDPRYRDIDAGLPSDPDLATWYEWDARLIQCHDGWSLWPGRYYGAAGKGGDAVRIAVIDSGIDYNHPDFRNAGATGTSSSQGGQLDRSLDRTIANGVVTPDAWDEYGHGMHVAGIAAASTNNGTGVTGNGYNSTVLSIKVIDAAGTGTESDIAQAIVYAVDQGAVIINISLGGYDYSQVEQDAVDYAWSRGTLVIAAAGNDGVDNKPNYPGALSRVLAVSATAREERLALYSNYGPYIGLSAPGGDFDFITFWFLGVYSTMPTYDVTLNGPDFGYARDYEYLQGTSMASPQVAGLAALYAGQKGFTQSTPDGPLRIWQALQKGCDNISGGGGGWDPVYGFGRINIYNTLNLDTVPNPRGTNVGCVTGQVRYRGTPIQNALVRAVPAAGGAATTASSRADGGYRVVNAPAGIYNITATVFGESQTLTGIPISAGCDMPGISFDVGGVPPPPPPPGTAPAPPTNLTATAVSASQVDLGWTDASSSEDGFRIERSTDGGASYLEIATTGPNTAGYSNSSLTPNTNYTYRVRAFNSHGNSAYAGPASALTFPAAPSGLSATPVSSSQVDLSWTDNSPPGAFKVERSTDGGATYVQIATTGAGGTSYSDGGRQANRTYHYRVRAFNAAGDSAYSAASALTFPAAPSGLTATAVSSSRVDLSWVDNSAAPSAFKVERSTDGGASYLEIAATPEGAVSFSDAGRASNTLYHYRVRAFNTSGHSIYSAAQSALTLPAAPSGLTATSISASQIDLSWTDNSAAPGAFKIERSTDGGATYLQIATTGVGGTSFSDGGRQANRTYHYRVRAFNAAGDSAYSAASALTFPAAPSGLTATAVSSSRVDLSWVDNSAAPSAARVERKLGPPAGPGTYAEIATTPAGTAAWQDTTVSAGTTYSYRVLAANARGDSAYSGEATATTPAGCSITVTSPAGGETWTLGESRLVTWTSAGAGGTVRIELSVDGGASWAVAAGSVANTGAYTWAVSSSPTTRARIRVTAETVGGCSGTSAGDFTIQDAEGGVLQVARRVRFRPTRVGATGLKDLVLKNASRTQSLRVTCYDPDDPFAIEGGDQTALIPPRGTHRVRLRFRPDARRTWNGTLDLESSDPRAATVSVALSGKGR